MDSNGIWNGELGMGRKGGDGEIRGIISKMFIRCRKENARIFGDRGITEGEIKRESRKEGMGVLEETKGNKRRRVSEEMFG